MTRNKNRKMIKLIPQPPCVSTSLRLLNISLFLRLAHFQTSRHIDWLNKIRGKNDLRQRSMIYGNLLNLFQAIKPKLSKVLKSK